MCVSDSALFFGANIKKVNLTIYGVHSQKGGIFNFSKSIILQDRDYEHVFKCCYFIFFLQFCRKANYRV